MSSLSTEDKMQVTATCKGASLWSNNIHQTNTVASYKQKMERATDDLTSDKQEVYQTLAIFVPL